MKRVSSPMQTKASANHQVRISPSALRVPATSSGDSANENTADASTKPSTNFGNRSQITDALGRWPPAAPVVLSAHQIASAKAATPISAFCENFTITPVFMAASEISAPAATTEAEVSSVPPSQAT